MLEIIEQLPTNNEYANARISKLDPATLSVNRLSIKSGNLFGLFE